MIFFGALLYGFGLVALWAIRLAVLTVIAAVCLVLLVLILLVDFVRRLAR